MIEQPNLIAELQWRGLIQDIVPGTAEQLQKEVTSGYIGFDPTADSLHIGSLVPILLLVHLQRAGHRPVALVGGATGLVGDPSFKSAERPMLDEATLQRNVEGIRRQLARFIDFKGAGAELVNNYDWFRDISFLHFIRDVGKHITVNYMMNKESVRKRIEGESGMSFTEFTYQLIQGYDFYWLYRNKDCKLQMGGSDQWGNITTGMELIRRKAGGSAFAFTCPLIKKADGTKFGKSEGGNVWLDAEKTTPFQFYQFWLNSADADAEQWIKIFTFLTKEEIEELTEAHRRNPAARLLQRRLAEVLTVFVHGEEELAAALQTTAQLFEQAAAPAESLSREALEGLEGVQRAGADRSALQAGIDIVSLLTSAGIFPSKGEARKMIANGGVSLNRRKVEDPQLIVGEKDLLQGEYLLVQKGKKNHFLLQVTSD